MRKIVCPEGFLATKPEKTTAAEPTTTGVESVTTAEAPEPISIDEHTPEPTDAVSLNNAGD